MVHRPADSRLLTNLLQHEKEYSKQLVQLLDHSNASLASFAAYAAASPPPVSQIILAVTGSLAAADEALKRYARGVDEWRETMRHLKDMEDEVGNIMRDREILVTRLIKASKSQKNSSANIRDSLLMAQQQFPSSSSLSLQDSPSPSRPLSTSFSSSTKLAAAQSELQACETHLAAKEHELALKRSAAVRDGLGARMRAMVDCSWAWGELGKEGLRTLDGLGGTEQRHLLSPLNNTDIQNGEHLEERRELSLPSLPPDSDTTRPSSDFSSISPSQSASQNGDEPPLHKGFNVSQTTETKPNATNSVRPPSGSSTMTGSSMYYPPALATTYKLETVTYAPAVALHVPAKDTASSPFTPVTSDIHTDDSIHRNVRIPAPHALEGYAYDIPTAEGPPISGSSSTQNRQSRSCSPAKGSGSVSSSAAGSGSGRSTPQRGLTPQPQPQHQPAFFSAGHTTLQPKRHILERRITEEELKRRSASLHKRNSDASSVEEVNELVKEGKLAVVENPRFMTESRKKELELEREKAAKEGEAERRRVEKGKAKEAQLEEQVEKEPVKEKKKFTFTPQHHRTPSQVHVPSAEAPFGTGVEDRTSPSEPAGSAATAPPSKQASSPSKRFLGSIRGLFGGGSKPQSTQTTEKDKAVSRGKTAKAVVEDADLSSDLDDDDDDRPPAKGGNALQNLFRSGGNAKKKSGSDVSSAKWETRTDKNIRELARKGSFDGVGGGSPGAPFVSGAGIAGAAVARAGIVTPIRSGSADAVIGITKAKPRARTASDVGIGAPNPAANADPASPSSGMPAPGRRLKKNRTGPPVSGSAAAAASVSPTQFTTPTVARTQSTKTTPVTKTPAPKAIAPPTEARAVTKTPTPSKKASSRRSSSVDVVENRRSFIEQESREEDGEESESMIVDLGRRRRAASELGGSNSAPAVPVIDKAAQLPESSKVSIPIASGRAVVKDKEYSSDTAALAPSAVPVKRKKSLTKKRIAPTAAVPAPIPIPTAPAPLVQTHPTSTPQRKTSVKSGTASTKAFSLAHHQPTPSISGSNSTATVLQAGGENPSGTLATQSGWGAHAQLSGGGLSRNSSVLSSASAPSGGMIAGKARKTTLGQGMGDSGGMGRRGSLGAPAASNGPASPTGLVRGATSAPPLPSVVQPAPAAPSLMSIVENVAKGNRDGWSSGSEMKKGEAGTGGSKKAAAGMDVVKAPPRVGREALVAMDPNEIKNRFGTTPTASGVGAANAHGGKSPGGSETTTGMFQIKAPGSVFDGRYQRTVSASTPDLTISPGSGSVQRQTQSIAQSTGTVQKDKGKRTIIRRSSIHDSPATASGSGTTTLNQRPAARVPLKSALRNPSPSPSPSPAPGPSSVLYRESSPARSAPVDIHQNSPLHYISVGTLPPPLNGIVPWGADGTLPEKQSQQSSQQQQPTRRDKGKGRAAVPPESGDESADDSSSTGNEVFYSDEEEVERVALHTAAPTGVSKQQMTTKLVSALNGHTMPNGHTAGYTSEHSESTTSTAMAKGGQPYGHSSEHQQAPRRRKSVRVSLQPTFSPSPPAIEYDEEEARNHAPWVWRNEHSDVRQAPPPHHPPQPLIAPIPVSAANQKTMASVSDAWADSSDDDEEYQRAKKALTRAAKKEKDVTLMVANRGIS